MYLNERWYLEQMVHSLSTWSGKEELIISAH